VPNVILIGDMNTTDNLIPDDAYKQLITCQTTSGVKGNMIDHAYVKLNDFVPTGHVLYKLFT
jgi:multidrug resistance efflux pump